MTYRDKITRKIRSMPMNSDFVDSKKKRGGYSELFHGHTQKQTDKRPIQTTTVVTILLIHTGDFTDIEQHDNKKEKK